MKHLIPFNRVLPYVAPYVGAWIETSVFGSSGGENKVAPYVGAWIETAKMAPPS